MNFLLLFAESQHLCGETCNESSRDLEIHSTTEWEAELQAKCFTACVDMVSAGSRYLAASKHPISLYLSSAQNKHLIDKVF